MELPFAPSSTVGDFMEAAVPPVAEELISASTRRRILETAAKLPGAVTGFFGFECPLSQSDGHADFLVCASEEGGGRAVLAGAAESRLPAEFESDPAWRRVFEFARAWNDPESSLFRPVYNVWLEFDTVGEPKAIPTPSVFFGAEGIRSAAESRWLTDAALPPLKGGPLTPAEEAQIARAIQALPKDAFIFQIGVMLSRPSRTTRLCVRGIQPERITSYLKQLGWCGAAVDLDVIIGAIADYVESFAVDIDVTDRLLPKIGIECYPAIEIGKERQLLDYLASAGYSAPGKIEAIAAWRGLAHERLSRDRWPRDLLAASALLGERADSAFQRRLHHVKIVYEPGKILQAKAYLAVQHVWIDPRVLRQALDAARLQDPPHPTGGLTRHKNGEWTV